jgi:CheY-like chemotaxis protein
MSSEQPALTEAQGRRRVLVVDDNVGTATMLSRLLPILAPCDVETATDGPSAICRAEQFQPHVIILDISLPGMDGLAVARRLRADERFRDTLLVALTGYDQEEDRQRSKAAGFDEHLAKPADPEALRTILQRPAPRRVAH